MPHQHVFTAVGALTALAALAFAPVIRAVIHPEDVTPADQAEAPDSDRAAGTSRSAMWLLGALAAACLLAEGAAVDWSAVHLRSLEASPAAAYAAYSASMAAGRLCGDRLTSRYGTVTVVRAGATLAAIGLGAGIAADSAPAALAGWMALGLGLSTAVPSLITAAGRGGPRTVGTVAATGCLGLMAGPAAIGALASLTGLTVALALPVLLAAVVAAAGRQGRPIRHSIGHADGHVEHHQIADDGTIHPDQAPAADNLAADPIWSQGIPEDTGLLDPVRAAQRAGPWRAAQRATHRATHRATQHFIAQHGRDHPYPVMGIELQAYFALMAQDLATAAALYTEAAVAIHRLGGPPAQCRHNIANAVAAWLHSDRDTRPGGPGFAVAHALVRITPNDQAALAALVRRLT
jgi:hypothetical protein